MLDCLLLVPIQIGNISEAYEKQMDQINRLAIIVITIFTEQVQMYVRKYVYTSRLKMYPMTQILQSLQIPMTFEKHGSAQTILRIEVELTIFRVEVEVTMFRVRAVPCLLMGVWGVCFSV